MSTAADHHEDGPAMRRVCGISAGNYLEFLAAWPLNEEAAVCSPLGLLAIGPDSSGQIPISPAEPSSFLAP